MSGRPLGLAKCGLGKKPNAISKPVCGEELSWICNGLNGGNPKDCEMTNPEVCGCDASTLPTEDHIVCKGSSPTEKDKLYAAVDDCASHKFECAYCLDPDKNGTCGDQTPNPTCDNTKAII